MTLQAFAPLGMSCLGRPPGPESAWTAAEGVNPKTHPPVSSNMAMGNPLQMEVSSWENHRTQ